jgi:NPCBM/NEW2 domain
MYVQPEDEVPRPSRSNQQGGRKGRRRAAALIPAAAIALVIGFFIGRATAPGGSTPVAVSTSPTPVTTPTPIADPTAPSPSLPPSTAPSGSSGASDPASSPAASAAATAQPVYLSQTQAVSDDQALNSPEDETISGTDYPDSIQQAVTGGNGTLTVWDTAQYQTFTAEVGIDDSQPADGQTARIVFMNQSSAQLGSVEVSIGSPKKVTVPLNGAVHFEIDCVAEGSDSAYLVTFGNAQFLP